METYDDVKTQTIENAVDFVAEASSAELDAVLERLLRGGSTKTPLGALLAAFICGYRLAQELRGIE
jgi:hypothetical protein